MSTERPPPWGAGRLFTCGEWTVGATTFEVLDKFSLEPCALAHAPSQDQLDQALVHLGEHFESSALAPYDRFRVLAESARLVCERGGQFVETMMVEAGFTTVDAEREVARAVQTLMLCGEEAKRIAGEVVPMDASPGVQDRIGFTIRSPLGIVCAITPFNSPLNTVAHKVAPAIAAGNSVVLKPSALTPLTAELLVRAFLDAGLPAERVALVHGEGGKVGRWLLEHPLPAFYAFTGSTAVGETIQRTVGLRRTQLELGSISSTIVCADADLDTCVGRCVGAAFRKAGQVCTSIQRLYVEESMTDDFTAALLASLEGKAAGDPRSPSSFIGPVISAASADRVTSMVDSALSGGARLLAGGSRRSSTIDPTVLADVRPEMAVMSEEIFGPVMCLRPFGELEDAVAEVNATPYGLAAGIFTRDLDRAIDVARQLRMGAVHINETSSSRLDVMPYAGVKASGIGGREGPRYAIEEMSEARLITISRAESRRDG